ncbi:MAG: carboxyl transferase domain-containing protein, partial [Acidobacteriota bacterium]
MRPLDSTIDRRSASYLANYAAMQIQTQRLRSELERSTLGGGEQYVKRHLARGKLLPRERVELLLDEGSYFLEIAPLAGIGIESEFVGAGSIGGIGLVSGRECVIIANEATVKGGSVSEIGQIKSRRLSDIAT